MMHTNCRWGATLKIAGGLLVLGLPAHAQYVTTWPGAELPPRLESVTTSLEAAVTRMQVMAPMLEGAFMRARAVAPIVGYQSFTQSLLSHVVEPGTPDTTFPQDSADGLYRQARLAFSRGEYSRAADMFRELQTRYRTSSYVPLAMYYQAFALYRRGTDDDLRRALTVLRQQIDRYPDDVTPDTNVLVTRIEGALARQGDAQAAESVRRQVDAVLSTREARDVARIRDRNGAVGAQRGQEQDDDIRMAALNALMHMDAESAIPVLRNVLNDRRPENVRMRRQAVFLVAQQRTDQREDILLDVARNDPDLDVRRHAVFHLSQVRTPRAVDALDSILQFSTERAMQERAIQALAQHRSTRAGEILRDVARRSEMPTELRAAAIQWLGHRRNETTFLRDLYRELDESELREKALFALSQQRDPTNAQFLIDLAMDETQAIELRKRALFWAGQMRVEKPGFYQLYDRVADRELKEQLIFVYSQQRRDSVAVDKLIDIVRNESDIQLRTKAIFWLGQTKDPRAVRILEEIINND